MAYKISDDCIACGACAAQCPVEAISEGDGKYVIDADTCVSCGACAGVCPVGAPAEFRNNSNWSLPCRQAPFCRAAPLRSALPEPCPV